MKKDTALLIDQISKSYGSQKALDAVSFSVAKGKIFGLLGPNGAGKTTLLRMLNGITNPDAGSISFFGDPLSRLHLPRIGYLPEERGLYKTMRVGEQALYFAQLRGMSKEDARSKLKHWFVRLEVDGWWNKEVSEVSKGMAQKIQFILSILHEPDLLILDEPLSGFDPINARRIIEEVRSLAADGTSVLLSTHDMPSVERLCDQVVMLNQGRVVLSGSSSDLRETGWDGSQEVLFKGNDMAFTHALGALANLDSIGPTAISGVRKARIRLRDGVEPTDVLRALTQTMEVMEFIKVRPTMETLFIDAVSKVESLTNAES